MINPSNEQLKILKEIKNANCVIDSVAGCGKTTTLCMIAMAYRLDNILALMYNTRQRRDTKKVLKLRRLNNIEVHTYHSVAYHNYGSDCMRNSDIEKIIKENRPKNNYFSYDIIIIDETQDFTDLYYEFVCKIIKDNKETPKIIILGDFMQEINVFNGSNIDYILNPEKYFSDNWNHLMLTKTFRLTKPMVKLVNAVNEYFIRGTRLLISDKDSNIKPKYYVCNTEFVYLTLCKYLDAGTKPHDIFILTPSIRNNRQISKLSNMLTSNNIPIYVSNDTAFKSDDAMNGKLIISTIHAIKGGERPIVMLLGFDDSVLPNMLNDNPVNRSAIIYVALTRAKEELLIFHHYENAFIVPPEIIHRYCDFSIEVRDFKHNYLSKKGKSLKENYCVTDMVKYLSHKLIQECKSYIIETVERPPMNNLAIEYGISGTVSSIVNKSVEEVADINGFLVPAYHSQFCFNFKALIDYFHRLYKNTPFFKLVDGYISELGELSDEILFDGLESCEIEKLTRAATIYNGLCNKLFFKIEQIKDFNWINREFLDACSARMSEQLSMQTNYEVPVSNNKINGIIDAVDGDIVYEFKCTSMIEDEHLLQLALYSYLMPNKTYKLFNIYTGEIRSIVVTDAARVAELLIQR